MRKAKATTAEPRGRVRPAAEENIPPGADPTLRNRSQARSVSDKRPTTQTGERPQQRLLAEPTEAEQNVGCRLQRQRLLAALN
ncbi:hypothetical protein chiPu_0004854 [Chiloscyllium punctatum]|uniref:Uncharacterized protein n=1 Tax=Chiloscyllium punctatum TaxID=137246 RepID=A0A401S7R3_CHIPU|nr:hypothetical protein [Chiloscyllium punctatum]